MKVTVNVMPYHIKYGERGSPGSCPIALAANRLLKPQYRAEAYLRKLWICSKDACEAHIDLPERAIEFTKAFDNGKTVEPFSFELDIPERFLR